jgi:glycosyltransferase involved in cell wall biosynthesis
MKITIVLGAFLPVPAVMGGAVEKVWLMLAEEFAARGHAVTVLSRAVPQFPRQETIRNVRHVRVQGFNSPRSLFWLKCLDLIYSIRAKSKLPDADVLITNTFWLPILVRSRARGRLYVHVARFPKGQLSFYGHAARLQAPSRAVAEAIKAQAPALANKVAVVPYPAPPTLSSSVPPSLRQRQKIILYVGRVHPEKGVHLLVEAFMAQACTVSADWKLMIVGPIEEKLGGGGQSYLASLKELSKSSPDQVIFTGPVFDIPELEEKLRSARLFVYPSLAEHGESFGLAPLEAMTHGCAVLVSDLACFRDFIEDGVTGFVFDHRSGNPGRALTTKIEDLIADETMLAHVAAAGYEKSIEYSLPSVADRFLQDFHTVTQDP